MHHLELDVVHLTKCFNNNKAKYRYQYLRS